MTYQTDQVRRYIQSRLDSHCPDEEGSTRESLLIRHGTYCGHRFTREGYEMVWFVEEDEIKFYGPEGNLLETVRPSQILAADRRAA